jgi:hypothetical protein
VLIHQLLGSRNGDFAGGGKFVIFEGSAAQLSAALFGIVLVHVGSPNGQLTSASLSEGAGVLLVLILDPQVEGQFVKNCRQSLQCFNFGAQLRSAQNDYFEIKRAFKRA